MTGRKPTPATLIDAAEHKKAREEIRDRQEAEQKLKTKAQLRCPKSLSDEARAEWLRIMKLYKSMDVSILCDLDIQALSMYCEAVAIYKKAQETWKTYELVVSGNPEAQRVMDKCFYTMEKQARLISSLAEQLCLTPVGRARMGMLATRKNKPPSELEALFDGDD